jgi:malonyl-CoA O-methyltransferase
MSARPAIRRSFARAAGRYVQYAGFQRETGERLRDGLPDQPVPGRIVDAGCGAGHGSELLGRRYPQAHIVSVDFALPMLRQLPDAARAACCCADVEALPLADACADLVWSNLTLQWCEPPRFMVEAARLLRPGGILALSTLGPATFAELRLAFAAVDDYRHTIAFADTAALSDALAAAGLETLSAQQISVTRYHVGLRDLLGEVRDIGANVLSGSDRRPGLMGRHAWRRFEQAYERLRDGRGLPLTYDTFLVYARRK